MLPKEEYFMPPVNLRVRDHRAFGRKPTVGMHVIRSLEKYLVGATPSPTYTPGPSQEQLVDGKRGNCMLLLAVFNMCLLSVCCIIAYI